MTSPIAAGGGFPLSPADTGTVKQSNPEKSTKGDIESLPDVKPNTPSPDTDGCQKATQQISEMNIGKQKDVKAQMPPLSEGSEQLEIPGISKDNAKASVAGSTGEQGAEGPLASGETGEPVEPAAADKGEKAAAADKGEKAAAADKEEKAAADGKEEKAAAADKEEKAAADGKEEKAATGDKPLEGEGGQQSGEE